MSNVVKGKTVGLKKIEQLLILMGFSVTFSNLYGYLFLDIIVSPLDFYPVFNIILFVFYFRCGTFINLSVINSRTIKTILFVSILLYNIISISMIFPWGAENIFPLYIPEYWANRYGSHFADNLFIERIVGIMGNANSSAMITVILIILLMAWKMYMQKKGVKNSILLNILFFSSLLCLLLSFSRTAILSLSIGYLYLVLSPKLSRRVKKSRIALIIIFISSITFFTIRQTDQLFGVSYKNLRDFSFVATPDISGIEGRVGSWKLGLKKYIYSPIVGTGVANATNIRNTRLGTTNKIRNFYSPHNEYINILMTTGMFGFFIYLLLFITVLKKVNIVLKKKVNIVSVFIAKSIKAIIIALALFNMAVGFWDNTYIPALLMLLFGALYAADNSSNLQAY